MLDATASETAHAKRVNDTDRVQTRDHKTSINRFGVVKLAAALQIKLRIRDRNLDYSSDMRVAELLSRFVGAARSGKVRIANYVQFS